jgi:hypothetical protein
MITVDPGIFSLETLRIFSEEIGAVILVNGLCIIDKGKIKKICNDDKVCKKSCDDEYKCHCKEPNLYSGLKIW